MTFTIEYPQEVLANYENLSTELYGEALAALTIHVESGSTRTDTVWEAAEKLSRADGYRIATTTIRGLAGKPGPEVLVELRKLVNAQPIGTGRGNDRHRVRYSALREAIDNVLFASEQVPAP